jgi:hypothetical protein
MTSALDQAIEECTATAKELLGKWRAYGSDVATRLDHPYDADTAAADYGSLVSLTVETGARLGFEVLNTIALLAGGISESVKSVRLTTRCKGARLEWARQLENLFGDVVPEDRTTILPSQLAPQQDTFTVRADTTDCPAGIYEGIVRAKTPDDEEEVVVRIRVP